jgi:dTDP-4-dehydrorhamnose 3,5-epimerase
MASLAEPRLIRGGLAVDDRGRVSFVNDFDFAGVKRAYMAENFDVNYVRAWHGHRHAQKWVLCVSGSALVCAAELPDPQHPDPKAKVYRFTLSASAPSILHIPALYANGFRALEPHTRLIFFSSDTLAESNADDFRYPGRFWDGPWAVEER